MLSTDDQGPDSAWDEDDDAEETTNTSVVTSSTDREDGSGDEA